MLSDQCKMSTIAFDIVLKVGFLDVLTKKESRKVSLKTIATLRRSTHIQSGQVEISISRRPGTR